MINAEHLINRMVPLTSLEKSQARPRTDLLDHYLDRYFQ